MKLHRAEEVAEIRTLYEAGVTLDAIRKQFHVSLIFVQNVVKGVPEKCASPRCPLHFYPSKPGGAFGSQRCYFDWVREAPRPTNTESSAT
jgi:hypothetical protein